MLRLAFLGLCLFHVLLHQHVQCFLLPGHTMLDPQSGAGHSNEEQPFNWMQLENVFVLIFNPRTENEGIHSLQLRGEDGVMRNTILLFENEDDAIRFGGLLEAQDFPPAHAEAMEPREIVDFVVDAGYELSFIEGGTLFMPPETNVAKEDMPWKKDPSDYEKEGEADDDIDYEEARQRLQSMFNK